MSDLGIFGPAVIDSEIGDAVQATLVEWLPTYLAYIHRGLVAGGVDVLGLPSPRSYVISADPHHFPEEQVPSILIAIPGTVGRPKRDGQNNYRALWDVRVTAFVEGPNRADVEALAKYYGTAIRMVMVQKTSLGNFAESTKWLGTGYSLIVNDHNKRTQGSAENRFEVDVRDVVQAFVGPTSPTIGIPADWPTVSEAKAILTPVALDALD